MEAKLYEVMMRVYYWLKLSLYYWLGWLAGGGVFGSLASLTSLREVHQEAKWRPDLLTWPAFWGRYRLNRRESGALSCFYTVMLLVLAWLIFITSQLRGFLFLLALVIQFTSLALVHLAGLADSQLRVVYQGEAKEFMKFAFVQLVVAPRPNLLTLIYSLVIAWLVTSFPALAFIFASPIWVTSLASFYLREWRRLGVIPHEEESQSL